MPQVSTSHDYEKGEFGKQFCSKCGARCCKVGVFVPLKERELAKVTELSRKLNVNVKLTIEPYEGQDIWVMSHDEKPCGFLHMEKNICLIYNDRPDFCKEYYCVPEALFGRGNQ